MKYIGPSKLPAPKASSQYQQPGLASTGDDVISVNNVNDPVKPAMSQRITRLNNAQREQMQQIVMHLKASEEAKREQIIRFFGRRKKRGGGDMTPPRCVF